MADYTGTGGTPVSSSITIVATAGSSSANSYITLAGAGTIANDYLSHITSGWTDASDDNKSRALIQATQDIESLNLDGEKYYSGVYGSSTYQALHFPTTDDKYNSTLQILPEVERAAVLQACYLSRDGLAARATADRMAAGVTQHTTGHHSESLSSAKASCVCPEAKAELGSYISSTISISRG